MDHSCSCNMNIASLSESQADRNVYEFDLSLWTLLKRLAQIHPREVSEQFSLPMETVEALADATKHQLKNLSSGVILSFKISTPEKTYISHLDQLDQSFDQICLTPFSDSGFGAAYWLLMGKVSQKDINIAAQTFGVSVNLAKIVSQASDNQLRNLACSQDMSFSIRFSPDLVREIIDSDEQMVTHLILKKNQQSITTTGDDRQ